MRCSIKLIVYCLLLSVFLQCGPSFSSQKPQLAPQLVPQQQKIIAQLSQQQQKTVTTVASTASNNPTFFSLPTNRYILEGQTNPIAFNNGKLYSDQQIDFFVFSYTCNKFIKSIMREVDISDDKFGLYSILSIMDIHHLGRVANGSRTNHVQELCNGNYTGSVTPLHWAAKYHRSNDIAKILLENDSNPNIVDANNKTALDYALIKGHRSMVVLLLQHGAKAADYNSIDQLMNIGLLKNLSLTNNTKS